MSYFDDNMNGGEGSDEEKKGSDSEDDVSEDGSEVGEEVVVQDDEEEEVVEDDEEEDDDDDEGQGQDYPSDEDDDGTTVMKKKNNEDEGSEEEIEVLEKGVKTKVKKIPTKQKVQNSVYDEDDDEDPTGEVYLQKFDKEINDNYLVNFHPESTVHNYDEILAMTKVVRDKNGIIVDDLHKTIPFLTKYEKARILGQRAKQINSGATVFVKVPEKVIDGYLIAELELIEKRVPFIIRRPLPNGGSEYWSIKDLENISF